MTYIEQCERVLTRKLSYAAATGDAYVDIRAADLHRETWGYDSYPAGGRHRMPTVCDAMEEMKQSDDVYLHQPPKGKGASLRIRYMLPKAGRPLETKAITNGSSANP